MRTLITPATIPFAVRGGPRQVLRTMAMVAFASGALALVPSEARADCFMDCSESSSSSGVYCYNWCWVAEVANAFQDGCEVVEAPSQDTCEGLASLEVESEIMVCMEDWMPEEEPVPVTPSTPAPGAMASEPSPS